MSADVFYIYVIYSFIDGYDVSTIQGMYGETNSHFPL